MLIYDVSETHETLKSLEFNFQNNTLLCPRPRPPPHNKLQACDVGIFTPSKAAYRNNANRLFQGDASKVSKQPFTYLYSPIREKAFTKTDNPPTWAASGLFPFNPDRVLRVRLKTLDELTITIVDGIKEGSYHQGEVPQTPVTAVLYIAA